MNIEKVVDLSLALTNDLPIYPGDPIPNIYSVAKINVDGYNASYLHIGSHTGTHVGAPNFRQEGETIDFSPLINFVGEGVLIDVTGKKECEAITLHDVEGYFDKLKPEKIALFHTGWTKYIKEKIF